MDLTANMGAGSGRRASAMRGRRKGRPRRARRRRCERCAWYRTQTAVVCSREDLGITLDVAEAERIVRERPRPISTLSPRHLRHYVTERDVVPEHVAHVDRGKPGILGVVRHRGRRKKILIEGSHRAFGSRIERDHFNYYELTEQETAACLC